MKRELQVGAAIVEKIALSMLGRDKRPLESLVTAAMERRIERELNRIAVYVPSPYNEDWTRARLGNSRRLDSVVLKAGQREAIVGDLERFFVARERYETLGIPWRRGYLLYGPPGTGKTSLVTALASELSLNVCVLSLASPNVTDEKIGHLLASVPRRSVILIEDVDAFFRQRSKADAGVKVSYSGFINALDGVAAHEGSVVFLTTNHPEVIDEAAIRSGRVDFRMELCACDRDQLERMFRKFFDDAPAAARFADAVPAGRYSPAQVQERLLKAGSPAEALELFLHAVPAEAPPLPRAA
jgi:chaperone BCS1